MIDNNKRHLAMAIRAINTLALTATSMAFVPSALAQDAGADNLDVLEEVVVKGIRYSLEQAADAKRNDGRVVDVIVAEDIGKLPDNNIAEALQRVTGVSINRDFGVGTDVSIRGLKENRVEVNGRSTMGDSRNGIGFEDFPASFLSAVEVIKSPTPEMVEGALGGTVNLKTARPLDLKETTIAGSLDMEYADKAENWAPVFNLSAGDNWDMGEAGTFGAMAMFSYQDRELRRDSFETNVQVKGHEDIAGLDVPAANTPSGNYIIQNEHKFEPFIENRERTAFNVSLQWAPASEQGSFYLDLNATERSGGQEAYSILHVAGSYEATADTYEDANGALNNYRTNGVIAIPKTWSSFRSNEAFSNAFGGEWNFTDKLKVSGEYSLANSETSYPKSEFNLRTLDPVAEAANPAGSNEWKTNVTVVNSNGQAPSVVYDDGDIYTQTEHFVFREFRHRDETIENEEQAWRLDVDYSEPFGLAYVSAVKGGVRFTERRFETSEYGLQYKDLNKKLKNADGDDIYIPLDDIASAFPGTIVTPDVGGDAFEHNGFSGANGLRNFTVYDGKLLQDADQTFLMVQQLLAGTNFESTGSLQDNLTENKSYYAQIDEDTAAAYIQAELDFDTVQVILGGRYVTTDINSTAYNADGTALVYDGQSYSDFLPSLNATYHLSEETLMRFAAAEVMRRPDFTELSPTYIFNSDRVTATRGNPGLEPYRATQYDVSLEHYFGQGNYVSAAVFYKDVASFLKEELFCAYDADALAQQNTTIYQNICIRDSATGHTPNIEFASSQAAFDQLSADGRRGIITTTKTNGENGKVQGFELAYQHSFDFLPGPWSGLGVNTNYTYADSEDPDGVPLEDISENTFNAQLFWEYQGFGVRLAYTFRDKFLDTTQEKRVAVVGELVDPSADDPTMGNSYRDDLSQWDLAANWDINDNIGLVFNVVNLTGSPTVNQSVTGTTWQIQETDRRYTFGVRAKF